MRSILSVFAFFCLLIGTAWAQASHIGAPSPGAKITIGKKFTVQIVRPNSIEGSTEVGIAICLLGCPKSQEPVCPSPEGQLGDCLYTGPFKPTLHPMGMFYQNFTLTAPDFLSVGRAQLAVARLHLIGAGPAPILEINNITVNMIN